MNNDAALSPSSMPAPARRCALSIVTTVYQSEPYLKRFVSACYEAVSSIGITDYEFVFVDDGSPDNSVETLKSLRETHPRIRIVQLSRNFGHHQAAIAGLQCSNGERVFLVDSDLEVDPAILGEFWQKLEKCIADVVFGFQEKRKGALIERAGGHFFWRIFNRLSDVAVPENIVTERLMTRRYVDALLSLGDRNIFLAGMMYWTGFVQIGLPVHKLQRERSTTYTFGKRLALLAKGITSFSSIPLYASLWIGAAAMLCALANAAYVVLRKVLYPDSTLMGFPTIITLLTAMFGIMMLSLGVVGIYVARIFVQTQGRPLFIIKDID
ncbi:MAG: glycosyltransferase family 2 protein [Granulicella sp.]